MRFPRWAVPLLFRLLSGTGLASASGETADLRIGFTLSSATSVGATPTSSPSQPRLEDFSLDLSFFIQLANHELKVPIMPLHLLGKKSWNIYNQDNIERVKRDEATAKAAEEAEEQRMQEADAERRMQVLRGEIPTPLQIEDAPADKEGERRSHGSGREKNRRKKAGENDTDFEMRIAHEQTSSLKADRQIVLRNSVDAPLVDHSGHIDLFPQQRKSIAAEKNADAEKEAAKKRKEYEDQYTMRFSNAAGFKQGLENPWYSNSTAATDVVDKTTSGKDVWGNEDPRRKEREAARIVSSDPLAMMRRGAAQVRQTERERKRWREEKDRELNELKESEERRKKHKRRHRDDDEEVDLENFRLDQPEGQSSRRRDDDHDREKRHRHKHKHSEPRRSSLGEESSRHRHRHRDTRRD